MALPFDPEGFRVVNVLHAGPGVGGLAQPGAGAAAVLVNDGVAHSLGTLQVSKRFGLRIVPTVEGNYVLGHYKSTGAGATVNECPIEASEEHVINGGGAIVSIIRDGTFTNNFTVYLYPLDGGTIT